ncbi:sodium:solute symporter family protein [Selenihalanaerobacter shriftii]|uniref:Solute:Na+ symporter, SSS family n=1 Tax=Selenihalanaerobacter shriftii TaxID=142842 RepID=A0A1T4KS02_9FIRM|nr:sodium:solute symporter [Selenihalanaerobacter shriftii]SJZ45186.1 solute:Na+ symporter, SSS family [Selenihalanaerobacter shriftii]
MKDGRTVDKMFKYGVLAVFVGVLLTLSYLSMKKINNLNDYFLGDRSIGPWVSAFTYGTTYFSAVLFIGYAGKIGWGFGLSSLWIAIGNSLVGSLLAWKVLAKKTRQMTVRLDSMTMPEFLESRYKSPGLKIFSSLIIFIFLVPYSASVYMGLSYFFEQIFSIPYLWALGSMVILTALFLLLGGYLAVAITDFIQGIVMVIGIVVMIYYVLTHPDAGGITGILSGLKEVDPNLVQPVGPPGLIPLLSLVVLTSLGSWGLPQMVQRFYTIKDEKSIKPAMIVATLFGILVTGAAYFIGATTHIFFDQLPVVNGVANADVLIPQLIVKVMPEAVVLLILLLVLSASMSTLSSLVLVSSSTLAIDLFKGFIKPDMSDKSSILLMRILCVVFVLLSFIIAVTRPAIILTLMAISWGTIAGAFLAPYLYGLHWGGITKIGAWSGIISGLTISLGLSAYFKMAAQYIPLIGSLAILLPLVITPIVSFFTPSYSKEHLLEVYGDDYDGRSKLRIKELLFNLLD